MVRKGSFVAMSFLMTMCFAFLSADRASATPSSEDVKKVQQALKDKGYYAGPVDGALGEQTRAAVRKLQKDNDLPATGRLDDETLDRLGVKPDSPIERFGEAGKDVGRGGKALGKGAKEMGSEVKEGKVGEGGKELGKGAGEFGKKVGEAAKGVGLGVKEAVTPDKEKTPGSDDAVKQSVQDELAADPKLKGAKVDVEVKDGVVTLSGHLDTPDLRDQAVKVARSVVGVKSVTDEIHVGNH